MPEITLNQLAIEVRAMRNLQKEYFELIGTEKKSKLPADYTAAKAKLQESKNHEKLVDKMVGEVLKGGEQ